MLARIAGMVEEGVDRMKTSGTATDLVAVGGGAFLIPDRLAGVSEVVRVAHAGVANALGAAMAQISGEVDQIFSRPLPRRGCSPRPRRSPSAGRSRPEPSPQPQGHRGRDIPIAYLPAAPAASRARVVGDVREGRRPGACLNGCVD